MRSDPLAFLGDELDTLKQQGLYRKLRVLEGEPAAHTTFDHKSVVNLSSNNYLGLTTHPKLKQAALDAVEKFGVGSGAVRTISGTMEMHMELERRLATFKHVEVGRRLSERLCRQRRHGRGGADQRRRRSSRTS